MLRPLAIVLLALSATAPAFAADPPSTAAAGPATPAGLSTDEFLAKLVPGNKFEIDSSKLALGKTKSETVRAFATEMVKDHSDAAVKLKKVLSDARLKAPSDALDGKHQALYDDLKKKTDVAFDQAYVDAQLRAHVDTVAMVEVYAADGDNLRLKAFANEVLPTLKGHLDHATKLQATLGRN